MNSSFAAGRNFLFFIVFASLALFGTSCGVFDKAPSNSSQESAGLGVAGEQAGSGLAVAGFQFVATQALEQQCDEGQSSACKIAFALDPNYKIGKTQEEINAILKSMNGKLDDINAKLNDIVKLMDGLASQLKIAVADLKMDTGNENVKKYMLPVIGAYDYLNGLDYSDNKTVDTPLAVSSIMTNSSSDNPYQVPYNLGMVHGSIVDDALGTGLLQKMDDLIKEKIDAIWSQGRPPTDEEAINHYELMEQYFGYLLMQQAKGLVVISASYKYLEKFPDARISNQSPTILEELTVKNFQDYQLLYNNRIKDQIKTFLQHVEHYIAYTADVDKPGVDGYDIQYSGFGGGLSSKKRADIKGWTSVVLKRADLTAAWARASLETKVAGTASTPVLMAVRVLGEPDRSKLFYSYSSAIRDMQTQKRFAVDTNFFKLASDQKEDYRILTARKPYMQFPVHLDKAKGTVERDGAIKGANSFIMNKYILTDSDGIAPADGESRPIAVESWVGDVGAMKVELVGPDGNTPKAGDPAMYYGHITIVLKETAARLGVWSHGAAGDITNDKIDNLTKTPWGANTYPQSIQLYVYADPHAWNKSVYVDPYYSYTEYYIKGHGYFYGQLLGQYFFEGWDDVPATYTGKVSPMLSGKTTHSVDPKYHANNGKYSMELYFALDKTSQSTISTDDGNVTLSVTSAEKWTPGTNVKFYVEPRIKLDWENQSSTGGFGRCTFLGTMKFDMSSLVLQVK